MRCKLGVCMNGSRTLEYCLIDMMFTCVVQVHELGSTLWDMPSCSYQPPGIRDSLDCPRVTWIM